VSVAWVLSALYGAGFVTCFGGGWFAMRWDERPQTSLEWALWALYCAWWPVNALRAVGGLFREDE